MTNAQLCTLTMLTSAQTCIDDILASRHVPTLTRARQQLRHAIVAMTAHAAAQASATSASEELTRQKMALRHQLRRHHMLPISRIAKCDLGTAPQFAVFRLPNQTVSTQDLVEAAQAMAAAADAYRADFIAAGLPLDFIDQLEDAARATAESMSARSFVRGAQTGATDAIQALARQAGHIVGVLDALISVAFENEPSQLLRWAQAKRMGKSTPRTASA